MSRTLSSPHKLPSASRPRRNISRNRTNSRRHQRHRSNKVTQHSTIISSPPGRRQLHGRRRQVRRRRRGRPSSREPMVAHMSRSTSSNTKHRFILLSQLIAKGQARHGVHTRRQRAYPGPKQSHRPPASPGPSRKQGVPKTRGIAPNPASSKPPGQRSILLNPAQTAASTRHSIQFRGGTISRTMKPANLHDRFASANTLTMPLLRLKNRLLTLPANSSTPLLLLRHYRETAPLGVISLACTASHVLEQTAPNPNATHPAYPLPHPTRMVRTTTPRQ